MAILYEPAGMVRYRLAGASTEMAPPGLTDLRGSREVDVQRRSLLQLLAGGAIGNGHALFAIRDEDQARQNHVAWVIEVLKGMQTIIPGMTREALYGVFTTEGGLSTGLQRTFVSRDCPYFKVDVEFQAVGRPERDADGRITLVEDGRDLIRKISRPYLQFSIMD